VLQIGFCWKGNRNHILFGNGTKQEMIEFVKGAIEGAWSIEHIGVAEGTKSAPEYNELSPENIQRRDDLGEFLNRPIFILKSNQSQPH
jgi:hypothetical protein